ncbi:hypothetical protein HU200_023794 [Digitaria exilis]|uniref:Uncharacterized protein n=1 Tax=Digitaria exilis TaxID=1010633 RepID=A0A835CCH3_9POAL|nr:hypothetical protein HU200_023794 [Digitaria exilis]CAB3499637.1 unnamed protein product [Digitaria exilis]
MPSTSGRGKPSGSSSAIVADRPSGYHDLKIDACLFAAGSVPTGESLQSCPFTVGGHRWRIKVYPNGANRADAAGYVSLYLRLDDEDVDKPVTVQMQFIATVEKRGLFFLKCKKKVASTQKPVTLTTFDGQQATVWGYSKFAERGKVHKHVRAGRPVTIRCVIVVHNAARAVVVGSSTSAPPSVVPVPPSNLSAHLGDLLSSKRGADVVFEIGGGETFAAHRAVLAARSPVFAVELFGAMMSESDAGGVVRIDDMEPQVFQALLRFVYTDSVPEMTTKEEGVMYQHLLVAADRYDMERLKLICEDKLCRYVDVGTAAIILTLAEQHNCSRLKKVCLDFVSAPANLKAVVASDGFEHLSTSCPTITKDLIAMLAS